MSWQKLFENPTRSRRSTTKNQEFAGYKFTSGPTGTEVQREKIAIGGDEDYGADPLGDGTFRMVPSGDIVTWEERERRLARFKRAGR